MLGYVRPECDFTTLEALIERIHRDGDVARWVIGGEHGPAIG